MSFSNLGLSSELLRAVADQGYETPTPVQLAAIPLVLAGRDLLAGAQTGTGKTAAFVLPIIHRLHETRKDGEGRHAVRVLVVVPTRELAIQVEESVRTYGAHRPIRSATVYGGVGIGPQISKLRAGPEIVVATPGRLLDHLGQGTINLSKVEVLVLDEADRMLDMGFIRDIRKILSVLPPKRQNLLFSATFSDDIRELASSFLHDPAMVQVTPRNTAAELVRHLVIPVDRERKRDLLRELVALGRVSQALVFARTKHGANRLAQQLDRDGISAAAIHGNRSQSQRVRALEDFKAGRVSMLVATDIAARGLDIEQLPHVVNFELPMVPEDYVHRIGRTGRAGQDGEAISLVCVDEAPLLRSIQHLMGRVIESEVIPGFEPDRQVRAEPIRLRSTPAERAQIKADRAAQHGDRSTERPAGRPGGRPGARPTGRAAGRPDARPASRPGARPDSRPDNRPEGRPGETAPVRHTFTPAQAPARRSGQPARPGAADPRGSQAGPAGQGAPRGGAPDPRGGHVPHRGQAPHRSAGGPGRRGGGAPSASGSSIGQPRTLPGESLSRQGRGGGSPAAGPRREHSAHQPRRHP